MGILGLLLIILALPLLIVYAIGQPKNRTWLRLGLIMSGVGLAVIMLAGIFRM